MTQYQIQNAVHKIDGYHLPLTLEPLKHSFARAKIHCIDQLKQDIADVESATIEQFMAEKRIPVVNQ